MELTELKGIGPKTEKLFQKLGIRTVEDLVYDFPHTYLSYPKTQVVGSLVDGEQQAVMGMLEKDATVVNLHGLLMTSAYVRDLSGKLRLSWFNSAFLKSTLRAGTVLVFLGKVTSFKGQKTMQQPRIFRPEEYAAKLGTLEPVYGQTKGLSNNTILKAVRQAMEVYTAHFAEQYRLATPVIRVYDSADRDGLRGYLTAEGIGILLINRENFDRDANLLRRQSAEFSGRTPLSLLRRAHPLVVTLTNAGKPLERLLTHTAQFAPLCTLAFTEKPDRTGATYPVYIGTSRAAPEETDGQIRLGE